MEADVIPAAYTAHGVEIARLLAAVPDHIVLAKCTVFRLAVRTVRQDGRR